MRWLVTVLIIFALAGCSSPADPLVPLSQACVAPAPRQPDVRVMFEPISISRSGGWHAYPGWTIPLPHDVSYQAFLEIPTTGGFTYNHKAFRLELITSQWQIAKGSLTSLPTPDVVGAPIRYGFNVVPSKSGSAPGAGLIRIKLEGVRGPDGKPVQTMLLRVVGKGEGPFPACPDSIYF